MLQWLLDRFSTGLGVDELARRLDLPQERILATDRSYEEYTIKKKSGGTRRISAPCGELKTLQRRILRRLLKKLQTHPLATGFQPGVSFVDNARCHQSQQVVIRLDLVHFFPSIKRDKVESYFRQIGWNRQAARLLTDLTTHHGELPQGAPTSPRLSNLVNFLFDVRLAKVAEDFGAVYTRYADDITFSLSGDADVHELIRRALLIIRWFGYRPHLHKKFDVRRKHQRQVVTGLVVNERAALPREKRRWLRAVEHRTQLASKGGYLGPKPTLNPQQLMGWRSLQKMIRSPNE